MQQDTENTLIAIDGAFGEGGGQIIRTAVSLSALTGQAVEITNIRAGRSKPGLQAQHLTAVRAAAALCGAALRGAELGSQYVRFTPGVPSDAPSFDFAVGTAGATGLVAQTVLVPMTFPSGETRQAEITGGTHVPNAPTADYLAAIYAPLLARMGVTAKVSMSRAGFFPKGGGALHLRVNGSLQSPIDLTERGKLKRLRLTITTAQLPSHVAERGQNALRKELRGYGVPVIPEIRELESSGPGAAILLTAECENGLGGWSSVGERGKPMERVAGEVLRDFQKWYATETGADAHLADQLVLPCALVPAESRWTTPEITEHLRTVLWVTAQFLPVEYAIESREDGSGLVRMRGVSLT